MSSIVCVIMVTSRLVEPRGRDDTYPGFPSMSWDKPRKRTQLVIRTGAVVAVGVQQLEHVGGKARVVVVRLCDLHNLVVGLSWKRRLRVHLQNKS